MDLGNGYTASSAKPLAKGGFGKVYLATKRGQKYAVKVIECSNEEDARDAVREAQILQGLQHRNILHYVDSYSDAFSLCIVTEYCAKGTLITYVRQNQLSRDQRFGIFCQLSEAIRYLHEDTSIEAHRDLKPENILISAHGAVRVADFGLAKVWSHSSLGSGNLYSSYESYIQSDVGTPAFAAPEVFNQHYTKQSDIFSLGLIFATVTEPQYRIEGSVYTTRGASRYVGQSLYHNNRSSLESLGVQFPQTPDFEKRLIRSMLDFNYHARPTARQVMESLRAHLPRGNQQLGFWTLVGVGTGLLALFLFSPLSTLLE